jgi:membrane protein implicated in regulation of membrane protease activity
MTLIRTILTELIHLFVDDGALAALAALLIALAAGAVKLLALPPLGGAMVVLVGSIAILADSVRRAARRQKQPLKR